MPDQNKRIKVLFLVPYPIEGPSNRYRVNQFLPYLERFGITGRISNFYSKNCYKILYKQGHLIKKIFYLFLGTIKRIYGLISIINYDIVFIHLGAHPLGPPIFEYILKFIKKPIIYDLDDAIYVPQSLNKFINLLKWHHKVPQIIRMSSQVITCNDYLEKYARQYTSNVTTIYTAIDTERFILKKKSENKKKLTLGWIGSHSTTKYLESVIPVIRNLEKKYDFEFLVVGAGKEIKINDVKVINRKWTLEREVADFQDIDIGIYPLLKDNIVNAKTGFKTRQYMACAIPCVVSNIGANKDVIIDGKNGFLVNNNKEWMEKLSLLIESPELRKKIGLRGRKTIEKKYSVKVLTPVMAEVIRNVYKKKIIKFINYT